MPLEGYDWLSELGGKLPQPKPYVPGAMGLQAGSRAEKFIGGAAKLGRGTGKVMGPAAALIAGAGVGAVAAAASLTLGAAYLGYKALKGSNGSLHGKVGPNHVQLSPVAQTALITNVGAGAAAYGIMASNRKAWTADLSPHGNLEAKTPAQFNATGDLVLSQRKRYSKK
jgi:hypothetical protein